MTLPAVHNAPLIRVFACEGKVRYHTWSHAERVVKAQRRKDRKLGVYVCRWCQGFHLGNRAP